MDDGVVSWEAWLGNNFVGAGRKDEFHDFIPGSITITSPPLVNNMPQASAESCSKNH